VVGVRRLALVAMLALALPASASAQGITEFPLAANADPTFITTGHDGRLWYASNGAAAIGRIGTNGVSPPLIGTGFRPIDIVAGPDGAMFWTTPAAVHKRAAGGAMVSQDLGSLETRYAVATSAAQVHVSLLYNFSPDIAAATSRSNLDLAVAGTVISGIFPATLEAGPRLTDITLGPDNKLWLTGYENAVVIRTGLTSGAIEVSADLAPGSLPYRIAVGPDGAMWFTEYGGNRIGRITTSGAVTEFDLPRANVGANDITAGPDGALWFTEYKGNAIGRITTDGKVTEYAIPTANSSPWGIAAGPDGKIWFTEYGADKIGRLDPATAVPIGGGGGGGGGGPRGGGPGADRTKPAFQGRVTISRKRFTVGRAATPFTIAQAVASGTTFGFALSEPARVSVKIERKARGRRARGRCRAKARTGKRCTLWVSAGRSLARQGLQGPNSIAFSGRLGRKALAAGTYRALITATDAARNRSRTAKLGFTIVPKRLR
jgi:streptogramin lyase